MKQGIAWIILITDDYDKSFLFYKNTLGFTVEREVREEEFCQFSLSNCNLAIYGRAHAQKLLGSHQLSMSGGAIYSFPNSDDIDADYEKLKNKGVSFLGQPTTQPWGQRTAYFTDPDGHIWELQQWQADV